MRIDEKLLDTLTRAAKESPLAGNGSVREALSEGSCQMMSVELGQWHRLEALESGTVIFESKDGPYEPLGPEDVMGV